MKTLERFSQSDKEHDLYMRRMEFLSVQATLEEDREEAFKQKEEAISRAQKAELRVKELEKALAEAKKAQK